MLWSHGGSLHSYNTVRCAVSAAAAAPTAADVALPVPSAVAPAVQLSAQVIPDGVHICTSHDGQCKGEAFVEFER